MLVKITQAHARGLRVFNPGQELTVSDMYGHQLIREGLAERIGEGEPPTPIEPKGKAGRRKESR